MNLNTEIQLISADATHFDALTDLGRTYYADDHPALSEIFLRWLYLGNPAGPANFVIASEAGSWIGVIALIPVVLESKERGGQKACFAVNVLTHPNHRGKNLFVKMISCARQYLSANGIWLLGHPNTNAMPGWVRQKMEFREVLRMRLLKPRNILSSLRVKTVTDTSQLTSIPKSFWQKVSSRDDIHLQYSPEFVDWRFLKSPHRDYSVYAVYEDSNFLGLVATRLFKGMLHLMVDAIGPVENLGKLVSSIRKPAFIMHSGAGPTGEEICKASWSIPVKRQIPFFVTTWGAEPNSEMAGITLAASDF